MSAIGYDFKPEILYLSNMEYGSQCTVPSNCVTNPVFAGHYSAMVIDSIQYGCSLILPATEVETLKYITVSLQAFLPQKNNARIVVTLLAKGKNEFYREFNLYVNDTKDSAWYPVTRTFELPDNRNAADQFRFYIWNPDPAPVYVDDVEVWIYKEP